MAGLTEPEALVWAAAFTQTLIACEDADVAVGVAFRAVEMLRRVRVRGRREQPMIKMLAEFRLDDEKEDE